MNLLKDIQAAMDDNFAVAEKAPHEEDEISKSLRASAVADKLNPKYAICIQSSDVVSAETERNDFVPIPKEDLKFDVPH